MLYYFINYNKTITKAIDMSRPTVSTLSKSTRRALKEMTRPLVSGPVYTTSDFFPLQREIANLKQKKEDIKKHKCTCDYTEIPCCSDCADLDRCYKCFVEEENFWDLFAANDTLWWLRQEYTNTPTFSAEEVTHKGAKKDRTCWNHKSCKRLGRVESKYYRADHRASKMVEV